jgi:hypothetical protein
MLANGAPEANSTGAVFAKSFHVFTPVIMTPENGLRLGLWRTDRVGDRQLFDGIWHSSVWNVV